MPDGGERSIFKRLKYDWFERHDSMVATIKTAISIQKSLFDQAGLLAQQLNISQSRLCEIAIEDFIKNFLDQAPLDEFNNAIEDQLKPDERVRSLDHGAKATTQTDSGSGVVNQGDIFWIRSQKLSEAELGYYPHPYVVIQDNLFNYSRLHTVVVCALTSNLKQANAPGNVLLEVSEGNLPRQSAVVVSKVSAVNKSQLGECIGSLNQQRINQILAGMRFLQLSFFAR